MSIVVTRREANLLTVARVAVGLVPATDAMRLLAAPAEAPSKLGPTARAALADTLARGCVLALAKRGGWLCEGPQRLWERVPAPPLAFSGNTVRLLSWVLNTPLSELDATSPLVFRGPLTVAEDLLVTLLISNLRGTGCERLLAQQPALQPLPLTRLTHAAAMAGQLGTSPMPAFEVPALAPFVEGLRLLLAESWLGAERSKRQIIAPLELMEVGRAQSDVLEAWLAAVDQAGRRDLATFLIDVAATWLKSMGPHSTARELNQALAPDAPLRERTEARRGAAAVLRSLARLREWDRQHRAVRFFDDGYALAQRLIADWERLGERGFSQAASLVAELDGVSIS